MTFQEIGKSEEPRRRRQKAKRPANSSELLRLLHERFPSDTREEAEERFVTESDVPEFQDEQSRFWYKLHRSKLLDPAKSAASRPAPMTKEQQAAAVERAKAVQQSAILLDMQIGDKKLRDLTREECSEAGGWLTRIASKLKAGQKVGDAFTEKQLAALKGA